MARDRLKTPCIRLFSLSNRYVYIARAHTRDSAHARTRGIVFNSLNTFNRFST